MRFLIVLVFFYNYLFCENPEDKSAVGLGIIYSESKYEGIDKETTIIPLIKYNAEDFYIRGIEFGYKQIDTDKFKLNYILSPRLDSLNASDSSYLKDLEDRDITLESGVLLVYKPLKFINLSTKAKFDILGVHKGYDIGVNIGTFIPINQSFFISASYAKVYLSSELSDYYYGVSNEEATSSIEAYDVDSSIIGIYGINFIYKLDENIRTNFMVSHTKLSQEIKNSPIIKDKDFDTFIIGVNYTF